MKVIEQLRFWRADGTLNILINIHALSPAILESLEWWDFFDAEKAKGNHQARKATYMHFRACTPDIFDKRRTYFNQEIPTTDWVQIHKDNTSNKKSRT